MSDIEEFLTKPPTCLHPPADLELVQEFQRYFGGNIVSIYRCHNCWQEVERETPNRLVRGLTEPRRGSDR